MDRQDLIGGEVRKVLASHDRYLYSGLPDRPEFTWPGGRGLAFYIALNVEHFAFGEGLTEDLVPGMSQPDVLNSSWRDYGTRVGAWRLLDLFRSLHLPATILLNSEVVTHSASLVAAIRADGHEIAAHGRTNSESQAGLSEACETDLIRNVTTAIKGATGELPTGWLSPWLAETTRTPDLLQESGYEYLLDFCADDQPIWIKTRRGRILSLPYSQEINDSAAIIGRFVSARDFADMIIDQVDEMCGQHNGRPLVFGLAIHANIMGQPFRLRQLRRALEHVCARSDDIWITRAGDVAKAALKQPERFV